MWTRSSTATFTQTLVDVKEDFEQVLHVTPTAFANAYNIYDPDTGSPRGGFSIPNLASPMQFVCGMIGATQNTTAPETAKLCSDYLGPALRLLNLNYIPAPISPLKTFEVPSIPGLRNSKIDQSSPRWFSIGVPLIASRCFPRKSRAALAAWLSAFLIAWASSRIR